VHAVLRPLLGLPVLACLLTPAPLRAQDTTRVRADSVRADSARARPDTAAAPGDSAALAGVGSPRIRVPPPVPPPWRFQVDLGFQDLSGNRDLTVLNSGFTVERRPQDRFVLNLKVEGRYGRSNGSEAVNTQSTHLRFDWLPRQRLSPFFDASLVRDHIRKIALRAQVGTGFNVNVDTRDARRTWLSFGFLEDHQSFTAGIVPSHTSETRWQVRAATARLIGQSTRLEASAKYQPASDDVADYLAGVDVAIRFGLTSRMGLATRFNWARDSRPVAGVEQDDRALTVGLSLAW